MASAAESLDTALSDLDRGARKAAPGASLADLRQALAEAFGFDSYSDLAQAAREARFDTGAEIAVADFEDCLLRLGYDGQFGDLRRLAREADAALATLLPCRVPKDARDLIEVKSLDAIVANLERRWAASQRRTIAALSARGLPPAERSAVFSPHPGPSPLWFGYRWTGEHDVIEIRLETTDTDFTGSRLATGGRRSIWGAPWPDYGAAISAGDLLGALARTWPLIASDFLKHRQSVCGIADIRSETGRPDLPRFEIAVNGPEMEIIPERGRCRPGPESLIAAETLMTLGDALASGLADRTLRGETVSAWKSARALDDLPPAAPETAAFEGCSPDLIRQAASYYARKLGVADDLYTDVALFESSAHRLWYEDGRNGPEPPGGEGFRAAFLGALPPRPVLREMAERARQLTADPEIPDADAWELEALQQTNTDARCIVFYSEWPARAQLSRIAARDD